VKPHVVELAAQRAQTRFNVAKAIAISQLCKGHRQILVPTRESSWSHIAAVPRDATAKLAIRQEVQQLGENGSTLVHAPLSPPPSRALGLVAVQIAASQISL
jgi:hypothetical protein